MRKNKKHVLLKYCVIVTVAAVLILTCAIVLKFTHGSRVFRKYVCNPIPESVKNIKVHMPWEMSGHRYVMHFKINKADLKLILNSKQFKEISYIEYNDGILSYGKRWENEQGFFINTQGINLYEADGGKYLPRWFRLGEWKRFDAYIVEKNKPGFHRARLLLYNEELCEAYLIDNESRGPGIGPTCEEWRQGQEGH